MPAPTELTRELAEDATVALNAAWDHASHGVSNRHSPFHTPTLTTITSQGGPSPRTVVLRVADQEDRLLACHTRLDAVKVSEVGQNQRVAWHVYDRVSKLQVVYFGSATVKHAGDFVEERWDQTGPGGRACYERPLAPGTPVGTATQPDASSDGRPTFAVLTCRCDEIDWLYLHHAGHVRWRFNFLHNAWREVRIAP